MSPSSPQDTPTARPHRWRVWAACGVVGVGLVLGGGFYLNSIVAGITANLPPVPDAATMPVSVEVVDRSGAMLRPFTTPGGRWRLPAALKDVDPRFIHMLLAYEDQHFFDHGGVDWLAMVRAAGQFVGAGGHIVSGGSTLTMQVARLIEGTPTRDIGAKLTQIIHAQTLEHQLSKDQILALYLLLAPYGGNVEGVRAASLAYFGKEPTHLTVAQAALLVALPQSPEARRPDLHPQAAQLGRDKVLNRLLVEGAISAEEAQAALHEPIPTARRDFPVLAPQLARDALTARPHARTIKLTLDARLQAALEALSTSRAKQFGPKASVAILVADEASGDILASVGGAGTFSTARNGFLDMTQAIRSPGSTLKPLIYGLAFELGLARPASLIEDRPTAFANYVPTNFDGKSRGTVTVRQALTQSLNVPAVQVLDAVGPARLVARMKRAGVIPQLPDDTAPGLAIGLGGVGVSLRDLVSIYAAIARGGTPVHLHDLADASGGLGTDAAPVLSPVAAWYVSDILRDEPPPLNGSPGRIAYKTGTSYGYRDAWSIGYDGKTVIGVWVGRPDGAPVPNISGIVSAAPILFESFDRLGRPAVPLRPAPAGAVRVTTAELPGPLRHFRHPDAEVGKTDPSPAIAFPANGVDVDLGLAAGNKSALTVKVRDGKPPFVFLANGAPFARSDFARQSRWTPDGPGFVTLSVIDAEGRSDTVKVRVD